MLKKSRKSQVPKVGFMVISAPTHVELADFLGEKVINPEMIAKAEETIKQTGADVVAHEKVESTPDAVSRAVKEFERQEVDCVVFFIGTWIWTYTLVQPVYNCSKPIIIWGIPTAESWSLIGLSAAHGALDEVGIKHAMIYGFPEDEGTIKDLSAYIRAGMIVERLKQSTLGLIGGRSMGLYPAVIDPSQWMEKFGIDVDHTDQVELIALAKEADPKAVKEIYQHLQRTLGSVPPMEERMDKSIRLYLAMRRIIKEHGYNFTSLKCIQDLGNHYVCACLAQSLLMEEGFVSSCSADCNAALTSYIMRLAVDAPVFTADVNQVRKEDNLARLIVDGFAAPSLAKNIKDVGLGYQLPFESKNSGICIGLVCKPGLVTLSRLSRVRGKYVCLIASGEVYEPEKEALGEAGVPLWPHAFVTLSGDTNKFVQNLRSEYICMAYGDTRKEIESTCYLLDIETIII